MYYLNLSKDCSPELLLDGNANKIAYYLNDSTEFLSFLGPINDVNIFVGANNSGKSRFLRGVLKHPHYVTFNLDDFNLNFDALKEQIKLLEEKSFARDTAKIPQAIFTIKTDSILSQSANFSSQNIYDLCSKQKQIFSQISPLRIEISEEYFNYILTIINDSKHDVVSADTLKKFQEFIDIKALELFSLIDLINREMPAVRAGEIQFSDFYNYHNKTKVLNDICNILKKFNEPNLFKIISAAQRIYIPILRTTSSLYVNNEKLNTSNYEKITNNIFKASVEKNYLLRESSVEIRTGLDLYQQIRLRRNSIKSDRKNFEEFEEFISKNFFNNKAIDIVAKEEHVDRKNEEHIIVHIGDEGDRNIHDLGDGIQALIILLYPIFMASKGSCVFIEEPEINLHPGLQRIFLEQITTNKTIIDKQLKFFITTHSNHLLDIVLETEEIKTSIFSFQQEKNKENENIKRIRNILSGDTDVLRLLGVYNSSVFLANCSIWVEGHTDRIYIKSYLRAYQDYLGKSNQLKEDLNFCFFEYGGSNLSHYLFVNKKDIDTAIDNNIQHIQGQFLSNKIFLIADKDKGKDSKHSLFALQNNKNFKYHVLKSKEIENLLSPNIIKRLLIDFSSGKIKPNSKELEALKEISSYKNMFLGEFINKNIGSKINKGFWSSADKKTIAPHYKKVMAYKVAESITWKDMSNEAKELTKAIYQFITFNNQ